jgi:predicted MFS family arabinose efflux permease
MQTNPKAAFTGYEKFLIAILTILQFTVILDFMVLSPLGAILMPALSIDPQQFGWVVSAYAFSAGASGLLAAGFADRFDRKRMLLVFYTGFLAGTLLCGLAPDYHMLLAARVVTGGFMLMPFGSAFGTGNLGLSNDDLPTLYMVTGITAMIAGPIAGRLSDTIGKYKVFTIGSTVGMILVLIYTQLGKSPLWLVMLITAALFAAITARIVGASSLMSGVPAPQDRGAFVGVSSAFQQISGGIASAVAGAIVVKTSSGSLARYDVLGYVVVGAMVVTIVMMYTIHRLVMHQDHKG